MDGFDQEDFLGGYGSRLYIDSANPLIRRLSGIQSQEVMENVVRILYVHAMLAGHYTLGERELEILNTGLIELIAYGLGGIV